MRLYSEIRKEYELDKLESNINVKAFFTHFLQNGSKTRNNPYLPKLRELLDQDKLDFMELNSDILKSLSTIKWDIPFPLPTKPKFKFIDLFAGIGGFRIAAQESGGKCVFSSEFDPFAQRTYEENFGEVPFGDISKIEANEIPDHDVLFAGFPCQPFSFSGRNEGFKDKTRGTLFFDVLRILEKKQPKMFLLENVKGILSNDGGKTLSHIEQALKAINYNIEWKVLKSYDFGLPQMRERWYCVGWKSNSKFEFPTGLEQGSTLADIVDPTLNDDSLKLSDFELERIQFHFKNVKSSDHRVQHDSSMYEPHTKKGRHGVFSFQKKDGALRFHVGDRAKTQIQEAFYSCQKTYAPTIIANRVPKLWDLGRKLSVHESKLLQGFPKEYKFPVSSNQAYKQLGNSVSVPVIRAIVKNMTKIL